MRNKIIISFVLVIIIFLNFNNVNANNDPNEYHFTLEDQIDLPKDKQGIYINQETYLVYDNKSIDIYILSNKITLSDKYTCHDFYNNSLFICSSAKLYIVNLNLLSIKEFELGLKINDILVDEYIYLVGNTNNNPSILLLNLKGEFEKTIIYEGDGYAQFESIHKIDENKLLLIGNKDAFFEHPEFSKVGNKGDIKSFIFVVDKALRKTDEYYFNEYTSNEAVISIGIDKNINIILQTEDSNYFYCLDKNLSLQNYFILEEGYQYYYIPNRLEEILLIRKQVNQFDIGIYNNSFSSIFHISYQLINFELVDGGIALCFNNNISLYSEYHITKKEPLVLSKLKYDVDATNHFQVASFFEELAINLDRFTPFHIYMVSGNYEAFYKAINTFGNEITITTDVIVKDFVNVIDGGIYNINTKLQFFGNATLNEENINNGHTLKDVGKYELILTNVNGISKIYRFEVVDNYYKDNDHYVLDTEYSLNPNEEIIIEYELDDIYKVKYFIINGSEYYEFEQVNNKVLLKLYGSDKFNYEIKKIESIVLEEGDIKLDEEISILTKKTLPNINVFSNSNQSIYEIHISYEDKEQTFVDLCFIESNKNIKKTYLKDTSLVTSNANVVLQYELGDGLIQEENLFNIVGENVKTTVEFANEEIIIKIYPNKSIRSINVNNKNIYVTNNDKLNLYILIISILSSIIIILSTVITLIFKKKIRKVNRI